MSRCLLCSRLSTSTALCSSINHRPPVLQSNHTTIYLNPLSVCHSKCRPRAKRYGGPFASTHISGIGEAQARGRSCENVRILDPKIYIHPGSGNLKAKGGLSPAHTSQASHRIKQGVGHVRTFRLGAVIGRANQSVKVDRESHLTNRGVRWGSQFAGCWKAQRLSLQSQC
jgi:hypothetical protein